MQKIKICDATKMLRRSQVRLGSHARNLYDSVLSQYHIVHNYVLDIYFCVILYLFTNP
jgi:hypothetical protein